MMSCCNGNMSGLNDLCQSVSDGEDSAVSGIGFGSFVGFCCTHDLIIEIATS